MSRRDLYFGCNTQLGAAAVEQVNLPVVVEPDPSNPIATSFYRDNVDGWYGNSCRASSLYFSYINHFFIASVPAVKKVQFMAMTDDVAGIGSSVEIRIVSTINEVLASTTFVLSSNYQLIEFDIADYDPAVQISFMLEYKSDYIFYIKEIFLS